MKLFTRYYIVTSKDTQSQEKCRFLKTAVEGIHVKIIMLAENFTIFVTQLLTRAMSTHVN